MSINRKKLKKPKMWVPC